jgi:hypothetical protein
MNGTREQTSRMDFIDPNGKDILGWNKWNTWNRHFSDIHYNYGCTFPIGNILRSTRSLVLVNE